MLFVQISSKLRSTTQAFSSTMSDIKLIFDLPVDTICEIVGKWLYLKDVAHLDSAFCARSARHILLDSIFNSPLCVANAASQDITRSFKAQYVMFQWAFHKGIRLECVHLTFASNFTWWKEHLQHFGHCVRRVHISGLQVDAPEAMALIEKYCWNVSILICSNVSCSPALLQLLSTSICLREFQLDNYENRPEDVASLRTAMIPKKLKLKILTLEMEESDEASFLKLCDAEHVQRLRIRGASSSIEWSRFTDLRALGFHQRTIFQNLNAEEDLFDFNFGPDVPLLHIFTACPHLVHLDLSSVMVATFSDDVFVPAIGVLHALRSLNISHANDLTDVSIHALVRYHKHSLEALYVFNCARVSASALNHALSMCLKLRAIGWSKFTTDTDFQLLCTITTIITPYIPEESVWTALSAHGDNVQCLQIRFPEKFNGLFELVPAACDNVQFVIDTACALPSLRALYLGGVCKSDGEEIRHALDLRRPALLIAEEQIWYDLNNLRN